MSCDVLCACFVCLYFWLEPSRIIASRSSELATLVSILACDSASYPPPLHPRLCPLPSCERPSTYRPFHGMSAQVPPAKRVVLTSKNEPPVRLLTRIEKPGMYTLYVTASMRWSGSGPCADPSETPIRLMQFRVPESLYAGQGGDPRCGKVSSSGDASRCRCAGLALVLRAAAGAVVAVVCCLYAAPVVFFLVSCDSCSIVLFSYAASSDGVMSTISLRERSVQGATSRKGSTMLRSWALCRPLPRFSGLASVFRRAI